MERRNAKKVFFLFTVSKRSFEAVKYLQAYQPSLLGSFQLHWKLGCFRVCLGRQLAIIDQALESFCDGSFKALKGIWYNGTHIGQSLIFGLFAAGAK